MNNELRKLAVDFITIPLAIAVFKHDQKHFDGLQETNIYLDLTDEAIRLLEKDLVAAKQQMYSKYHIDIKRIGKTEYRWKYQDKSGVWSYTPEQLKEMTEKVYMKYLSKARNFEIKRRGFY
ncbi:hypothetical protein [Virgibacillus proomii]|uniref:hypothetical protein n=1 Tax=Virgibacillus proomii TaxID=84407 RepID=UPI001C10CDAD|nr:hypothetical protein [Virgibacillus proomii]MBU5267105.1 hypothetical protein [Virgibacillus proomii]